MRETNILDALPAAVYTTDAAGNITYYNDAAAELWGHRPQLGSSQWCGSWRLYWPDGRHLPHDECPMAVMLKEGRAMPGVEAIAERPDGSRVWFTPFPRLIRDEQGNVTGGMNLLVDVTDRRKHDVESSRLAAIVSSSHDAIVSKTLKSVVTSWNVGAERMFGYSADEMIGSKITRLIPPELLAEEDFILAKLSRGEQVDHYDTVRLTKDGRRIDVSLTVSPLRDRSGAIVGASKIARDITERKRHEQLQRLLVGELNHRVKNTLAVVQSIAAQSLRHAPSPEAFVHSLSGRIQALARSHSLLIDRRMTGSDLADIIREQVMLGSADGAIEVSGPDVHIDSRRAIHLGLVLHELATNARKYGALSGSKGRLSITWTVQSAAARRLLLEWRELGTRAIAAPSAAGFGTTLIERILRADGGDATMTYADTGLTCTLELPLGDAADKSMETLPMSDVRELGRVLLVEDEPLIAMDVEAELAAMGYAVAGPYATVADALRGVEEATVDVAVLDANLQGESVEMVASALRRKSIPFVFATGYGAESLPAGFDGAPVLAKPFSAADLRETLAAILDRADRSSNVVEIGNRRSG